MEATLNPGDYYVDELLDKRSDGCYLVKWTGFPDSSNTWQPKKDIPPWLVREFEKKKRPRPRKIGINEREDDGPPILEPQVILGGDGPLVLEPQVIADKTGMTLELNAEIDRGKINYNGSTNNSPVMDKPQHNKTVKTKPVRICPPNIVRSADEVHSPILTASKNHKLATIQEGHGHWVDKNPWNEKPSNTHSAFSLMAEKPSIILKHKSATANKLTVKMKHTVQDLEGLEVSGLEFPGETEQLHDPKSKSKDILPNKEPVAKKIRTQFTHLTGCPSAFSKIYGKVDQTPVFRAIETYVSKKVEISLFPDKNEKEKLNAIEEKPMEHST